MPAVMAYSTAAHSNFGRWAVITAGRFFIEKKRREVSAADIGGGWGGWIEKLVAWGSLWALGIGQKVPELLGRQWKAGCWGSCDRREQQDPQQPAFPILLLG